MLDIKRSIGNDFLFYWTDAVFIANLPNTVTKVYDIIGRHGFEAKEVPIAYINVDYGRRASDGMRIYAWTEKVKGNAKVPIQDDDGFYGREFPFQRRDLDEHLKNIMREIEKEKAKETSKKLKKQNTQTHIENEKAESSD
jgi:hypothetical protein